MRGLLKLSCVLIDFRFFLLFCLTLIEPASVMAALIYCAGERGRLRAKDQLRRFRVVMEILIAMALLPGILKCRINRRANVIAAVVGAAFPTVRLGGKPPTFLCSSFGRRNRPHLVHRLVRMDVA